MQRAGGSVVVAAFGWRHSRYRVARDPRAMLMLRGFAGHGGASIAQPCRCTVVDAGLHAAISSS